MDNWIDIYKKFIVNFQVNYETKKHLQDELLSRINKYSYMSFNSSYRKYRISFYKLLFHLPNDLAWKLIAYKLNQLFKLL